MILVRSEPQIGQASGLGSFRAAVEGKPNLGERAPSTEDTWDDGLH